MIHKFLTATASAIAILSAATSATAGTQYHYDSAGRLIRVEYSTGVTIHYSYDAAGNRREITTTQLPNRPPVARDDSAAVTASGNVDILVRANDTDLDRNLLTITAVSAVSGGGTATIMGGGTHIRYTAPATAGVKSFTYTLSDGKGGTANATVTVTVGAPPNRAPIAIDDSASVVASETVDVQVRVNDSDPDGDPLSVTAVSAVTGGGTATVMGGGSHVRYAAPATPGDKTFTYTLSDGQGGSAQATVAITVTPIANRPPIAVNDTADVERSSSVAIMVRANDSDPDGDPLTVTSVTQPTSGSVTISNGGAYLVYTASSTIGLRNFKYTVSDGRGGAATATVFVNVTLDACSGPSCPVEP